MMRFDSFDAMPPPAPPVSNNNGIAMDIIAEEEEMEATQQQTQNSQEELSALDFTGLWGRLMPCNPCLTPIPLSMNKFKYTMGRMATSDIRLNSGKISSSHATLSYDATVDMVTITDLSSNGTFLNGKRVGRNQSSNVRTGDEIGFGTPGDLEMEDHRWIFRNPDHSEPIDSGIARDYDLGNHLGKGAFATVRKALHKRTGTFVAVKVFIKSRFITSPTTLAMFQRERHIISGLDHPNIVKFYNYYEDAATIFFVLELVTGGDLLDYIQKSPGAHLTEELTRHLTRQLCIGVAYAHSMGVTHRDLKPENILLTSDNPPNAKVADFGLAKIVDSQTFLKTQCGTPQYLAPEVILTSHGYDQTVDSWSLGVIVYCMLTGQMPFAEDDGLHLKARFETRTLQWEPLHECHVSPAGQSFVKQMICFDPRERLTMRAGLSHEWLRIGSEYDQDPHTLTPTAFSEIREKTQSYGDYSVASVVEIHDAPATPSTPSPSPKTYEQEQCSQDMINLRIHTPPHGGSRFSDDSFPAPLIPDVHLRTSSENFTSNPPSPHESTVPPEPFVPRHLPSAIAIPATPSGKRKARPPSPASDTSSRLSTPPPASEDEEEDEPPRPRQRVKFAPARASSRIRTRAAVAAAAVPTARARARRASAVPAPAPRVSAGRRHTSVDEVDVTTSRKRTLRNTGKPLKAQRVR